MIPNDKNFEGKRCACLEGITYYRSVMMQTQGKCRIAFRVISKKSPYKQGIAFMFSTKPLFKGNLVVGNVSVTPPKRKFFSYIAAEDIFVNGSLIVEIQATEGSVYFSNASSYYEDYADKIQSHIGESALKHKQLQENCFTSGFSAGSYYGNALWIEVISYNHYRCHCNDHRMDDNYDDMIIDIFIESGKVDLK